MFDASGIRKVFDLGAKTGDPINLSIGQPDFDVPEPVRRAAIDAIESRKKRLRPFAGHARAARKTPIATATTIRPRRPRGVRHLRHQRRADAGPAVVGESGRGSHRFRSVFRHVRFTLKGDRRPGGLRRYLPDFRIDLDRVADASTPRTKAIIFNSPGNPTGVVADEATVRAWPNWPRGGTW